MKRNNLLILLSVLLSMKGIEVSAYDIEVKNDDGVTIYYDYNFSNSTQLIVTYRKDKNNSSAYTGTVAIPETVTYNGKTLSVTSIGNWAFGSCYGLTSVIIPNSVTSIGSRAFAECSGLTSITIPNSVTSIGSYGDYAFYGCSSLTSITVEEGNTVYDSRNNCNAIIKTKSNSIILGCKNTMIPNSVTRIGSGAFSGCSGLTSITIPNSVTNIDDDAFKNCSGLNSITIPNSVTRIGRSAFIGCSGLTSITIPNSVTSIGSSAFQNCSGLTSITIPNSVTNIEDYAFKNCSGLTSITIPNSVTSIGVYAFAKCPELTDVFCLAEVVPTTEIDAFAFSFINNATLHVPNASVNLYKAVEPWKSFKEIVALTDQELSVEGITKDDMAEVDYYAVDGQRANQNTKGLHIIRMSDGTTRKVVIK